MEAEVPIFFRVCLALIIGCGVGCFIAAIIGYIRSEKEDGP